MRLLVFLAILGVRVGYEENYPLTFTDPGGRPSGLFIELFDEIARMESWEADYVPGVWPELMEMLRRGDIELVACMTRTDDRELEFLFPRTNVVTGWSVLLVRGDGSVPTLHHLEGQTVALIEDDIHSTTLLELLDEAGLTVRPLWCSSFREGMEAVVEGRAVAFPAPKLAMLSPDFPGELSPQGIVWSPMPATFAGNRSSSIASIEALDRNLELLKADSSSVYYRLVDKWLADRPVNRVPPHLYLVFAALVAVLMLFIVYMNRRLAGEVKRNKLALAYSAVLAETALAAEGSESLDELCRRVAEILSRTLHASNFYIAVHNPEDDTFFMPYFEDEKESMGLLDDPRSFTHYVHRLGKSVFLSHDRIREMIDDPGSHVWAREDIIPKQYLAVPMKSDERPIGVIAFQSYDDARRFTEADLSFVTGISGYIGSAVSRMRAREEVRRSQERQKILLEADPTAIFLVDPSGAVVQCNRQSCIYADQEEKDIIGRPVARFLSFGESGDDGGSKGFSLKTGFYSGMFKTSSGTSFPVEGVVNDYLEDEGLFYFISVFDISEKQLLQREAMRNQRLESIGLLAGGIAHDFNNILTGVMGSISLLRHEECSGSRFEALLESAEGAARRARELTGQLLTFARGGSPVKRSVGTEELLRDVVGFVLSGSSILVKTDIQPEVWNISADVQQFSQVVQNITTNARQAMGESGRLFIRARNFITSRGRLVLMEFEDTGPGIPADVIDRIFDPYFTTKPDGHGLGLATTYSIVQRHGGTVKAGNGVHGGALFTVMMPASFDDAPPESPESDGDTFTHGGRVLLLDDDGLVLETGAAMLTRLGYTVDTAVRGEDAVSRYFDAAGCGEPYRALIMDLTIPGGMGGAQAVKIILARDPSAVAIVSSGYAGNDIMADYASHGFRGVLTKPYTVEELSRVLTAAIEQRGRMEQN
jgi:nitrogen-specific signal transduction histidine kinase/CheY-like chemotaxis protein